VVDWAEHARREDERYRDGEARLPDAEDQDARQRQLTRMGNAAGGAGLARLMAGNAKDARDWFAKAVERYRESYELAPPGSWGRPIAILKARILAGDWDGAEADARWTLEEGAAEAQSPIGRYAATLALLVLGRDQEARVLADGLRTHDDFPAPVGDALAFIAAQDPVAYVEAIEAVLESFETREDYLEDIPAADTVLVLQALAARRKLDAELSSPLLP
jgi:tetratricopeptide (TPR) repeat protein